MSSLGGCSACSKGGNRTAALTVEHSSLFDPQIFPPLLLLLICTPLEEGDGAGGSRAVHFPPAQRVGKTAASTADATVNSLGLLHSPKKHTMSPWMAYNIVPQAERQGFLGPPATVPLPPDIIGLENGG